MKGSLGGDALKEAKKRLLTKFLDRKEEAKKQKLNLDAVMKLEKEKEAKKKAYEDAKRKGEYLVDLSDSGED